MDALPLNALIEELEAFDPLMRAEIDPYGTLLAHLEGGYGGETILLWVPWADAPQALGALGSLRFRGRVIVGIDVSPGDAWPLGRAVERLQPKRVLIVAEGSGIGTSFQGFKEVEAEGEVSRVAFDDPKPARTLVRKTPTGVHYLEVRAYAPWKSPLPSQAPLMNGAPSPHQGASALEAGATPYGLGRVNLEASLKAWLFAFGLLREGEP